MRTVPPCGRKRGRDGAAALRRPVPRADARARPCPGRGYFLFGHAAAGDRLGSAVFRELFDRLLQFQRRFLHFVRQQGMIAAAGVVAMIVISKVSYKLYARFYKPFLAVSVVLLILVAIPGIGTGIMARGAGCSVSSRPSWQSSPLLCASRIGSRATRRACAALRGWSGHTASCLRYMLCCWRSSRTPRR